MYNPVFGESVQTKGLAGGSKGYFVPDFQGKRRVIMHRQTCIMMCYDLTVQIKTRARLLEIHQI